MAAARCRPSSANPPARTDQKAAKQHRQRCRQRPLIALDIDLPLSKGEIMLRHGAEHCLEYRFHAFALRAERRVDSAGSGRDGFQCRLVQP